MPFPLSLSSLDTLNNTSPYPSSSLALSNHWSTTTFGDDQREDPGPMEAYWAGTLSQGSESDWGGFARQSRVDVDAGSHARHVREGSTSGPRWRRSRAPTMTTRPQDQGRERASYPCPFRKRNPARFNVRDHEACARGVFGSVGELRHHILESHQKGRRQHQCPRCGLGLENQALLDEHLLMPRDKMCDIVTKMEDDPEDGILPEVERRLFSGGDIGTWEALWGVVFPGDDEVPNQGTSGSLARFLASSTNNPEIHPIIELVEIEQAIDDSQDQLKASIHDKLRLLLPSTIDDSYCTFLTGQLELVVETHRANIIRQCLAPRGGKETTTTTPAAKRTSTIALAKRQTRRSRRSSMMQSIHGKPDDRQSWMTRPSSHSRFSSSSTQSGTANSKPQPPAPTSRESRDSGIGMPCEVCGGEDAACCCKDSDMVDDQPRVSRAWGRDQDFERYQHPNLSSSSVGSSSASSVGGAGDKGRSLRHKPRLRLTLRTKDIGSLVVPGQGGGAEDGGYSPQSFKQRVQGLGRGWSA
ncbi:hypothetical protein QBC39DRAFT_334698 [Podospora conica]|nr:hypothetical protein QBC39DRAFT_334698 [Schizothecium conicum]